LSQPVSGPVTAEYVVLSNIYNGGGGSFSIGQSNASGAIFPVDAEGDAGPNPKLLISSFVSSQSLEIFGSGSIKADSPGQEGGTASVQLLGLFDQNGTSLSFSASDVPVPEPTYFPVLSFALMVMLALKTPLYVGAGRWR
jgi:hypothetical protein